MEKLRISNFLLSLEVIVDIYCINFIFATEKNLVDKTNLDLIIVKRLFMFTAIQFYTIEIFNL